MENKRKTGREDEGKDSEGREDVMEGGKNGGTSRVVSNGVLINNSNSSVKELLLT